MNASTTSNARTDIFGEAVALWKVLAFLKWPLIGASVIEIASAVFAVAPYVLIVRIAELLLAPEVNKDLVWLLALVAVASLVLHALLSMAALTVTHLIDVKHQWQLRHDLSAKLGRLSLGWFATNNAGQVKKILQDDTHAIHYVVAHAVLDMVSGFVVPLLSFIYLFSVDWRLASITLAPPVAYLLVYGIVMTRTADAAVGIGQTTGKLSGRIIEIFDGVQVIRAFGRTGQAHRRFKETVDEYTSKMEKWMLPLSRVQALISVLLQPVTFLLLVLVAGAWFIAAGWVQPLTILPFLLLALTMGNPVLRLGSGMSALQEALQAARRLHLTYQLPEIEEPATPKSVEGTLLNVEYANVTFSYDEERNTLKQISFLLRPGTITALVGPSGSGKSTIAKLLPRFYDTDNGTISIGGIPIRDIPTIELYRNVGFVFQDVRLLQETVRDNIKLGRPNASEADVIRVAKAAQIHDRIERLPSGYDSVVGVDARFSGGEAQRITIARALLADAPILVLDEATAMIDPESEVAIQRALSVLIKDRTVLIIAHRLHTITGADQILVIDDGRIVQQGTHYELSAISGLYQRLWKANEQTHGSEVKQ